MLEASSDQRRAELLHQHADVRHLLDQLEAAAARPDQAVGLLEALRAALEAHFADEEGEEGLARAVGASAPWSLRRLEGLLAEHRDLLEAADRLLARARALLAGPITEFAGETRALLRRLRQHEERETALLSDAVHQDVGSG